jgi:hypothetical protein
MARAALSRLLVVAGLYGAFFVALFTVERPWYLGWGATREEAQRVLPGDALLPGEAWQETRAITIDAPVDRVWPWLAQIGQDRGGFYSFDLLENLVGCEMPTVDALRPGRDAWRIGDKLWMYPSAKARGVGFAVLREYIPGRALAFATHSDLRSPDAPEDGSWAFVLEPMDASHTRLLVRGRGAVSHSLIGEAFGTFVFEPLHFTMERGMMTGLKAVAEQGTRSRWSNHAQVALWVAVFALFVAAAVLTIAGRRPARELTGFVLAGVVFEILTLGQPALWIGVVLTGVVLVVTWAPRHYEILL